MKRALLTTSLVLSSLLAAACGDSSGAGPDGEGGGDPADMCPVPTSTTVHADPIEADETWSADSLHVVQGYVSIRNGATLTVDPCARIEVEQDGGLLVAFPGTPTEGSLIANGEAEHPITITGKDGAQWGHILFDAGAHAELSHVTISGGGSDDTEGATLVLSGDGTFPVKRNVLVDHVTIEDSAGVGLRATHLSAFADGSKDLTITASGNEEHPYPAIVSEHAALTLPSGKYTGNARDTILVMPEFHIQEDGTLRDLGVPYQIGVSPNESLTIGAGPDQPLTTLTVEPGVRMEFFPGTSLQIELATGPFAASGAIIAEGTASDPIVFTSASPAPAAGDWQGLWFGGVPSAHNRISNARIEYTGADCGCVLVSCSALAGFEGAVIFSQPPPSAFITDTTISHGSANGIVLGYAGARVDFKPGITFDDMGACEQTLPSAPTCPNPKPACE